MAEKIVSPGVFTNERDLSFLPAGIAQIGGAFIGPAVKGPAYVPIAVNTFTEFEQIFGPTNSNYYMPYSVKEYIQNGGRATVVRVMNTEGYSLNNGIVGVYAVDGATPIAAATAVRIDAANAFDTGSARANLPGVTLSDYLRISYTTASGELTNSGVLPGLTFTSASSLLTEQGNTFVSGSSIAVLVLDTDITDPAGSSVTYDVNNRFEAAGGTVNRLLFALHPTQKITGTSNYNGTNPLFETSVASEIVQASTLGLSLAGTAVSPAVIYTASLAKTSNNFITKVFPQNANTTDDNAYLYLNFPVKAFSLSGSTAVTDFTTVTSGITFSSDRTSTQSGAEHTYASTPWIISQTTNNQNYELFRFHTLSEGSNANYEVKVAISNIRPAGTVPGTQYGDFTVVVRAVDQSLIAGSPFTTIDSDLRPNVLETFTQCNLDITSKNYIGKKIGDRYQYFDTENLRTVVSGDYANQSKYIRVEVDNRVSDGAYPVTLMPFGHQALMCTLSSSFYSTGVEFTAATFKTNQNDTNGVYNKKVHFGFDYNFTTTDNLNYLKPIPNGATTGSNSKFLLSNYNQPAGVGNGYTGPIDLTASSSIDSRKFIVPFQGGFDGIYPSRVLSTGADIVTTNAQGYDFTNTTSNGYVEYKKAIDSVGSPTSVDINLLVMPGVIYEKHPAIVSYAEQTAQERGDTFFVFDAVGLESTVQNAVDQISGWDSNYAATYYPWVKITDSITNRPVWVPPSVIIPGVLAFNDKVGEQWFAPAGLNRGGLAVNDVYVRLNRADIDTLYDGRVNPIATIPNIGFAVWGQKTLQAKPSALDRINVRRLLIALKKFIASASQYLVFEQNTSATRNRFLNIVNPYMESVQQRQGIYAFKVVMDDTNNTPDLIDRNIMYGQIYLQPTRTAEFIIIDFNILPTGATFGA